MLSSVRARLISGVIFSLPIVITFWIVYWIFMTLERFLLNWRSMSKPKILVVDDDKKIARLLAVILDRVGGFDVCEENHSTMALTIAKGFRVGARCITQKEDLDGALEEMIDSKGPFLLDVQVPYQEHVLPMIPSGSTVRDIIKA